LKLPPSFSGEQDVQPISAIAQTKMKMLKTMLKLMFVMTSVGMLSLTGKVNADPVTVVAGVNPSARAQFVINNPSDRPIKYMMRWGESGVWNAFVLQPNHNYTHSIKLNESGEFPGPHVRFDDASGTGTVKVHNLYVGKDYEFRFDGNRLELYRTN
jgi:hypothetical protein